MSGRRYIITRAMQLPETAPTNAAGCARVEKLLRKYYANPAIADEFGIDENSATFTTIISYLACGTLTQAQLQFLLDTAHHTD